MNAAGRSLARFSVFGIIQVGDFVVQTLVRHAIVVREHPVMVRSSHQSSRKPKVKSAWPLATETYWRPSTDQVIGELATCPPRYFVHNNFPSRALSAKKCPSRLPEKTRSVAVVSSPLSLTSLIRK